MFFSVSTQPDSRFVNSLKVGNLVVSYDSGWHHQGNYLYKGYANDFALATQLDRIDQQPGNFCVMVFDHEQGTVTLKTSRYRSFPICVNDLCIDNLTETVTDRTIWSNVEVTVNQQLQISERELDQIGTVSNNVRSTKEVVDDLYNIIDHNVSSFLRNNQLPIKVFLSGGVDSMLVYSFLCRHTNQFELVPGEVFEFDEFWIRNKDDICNSWAYNQMHHWLEPCALMTGTPGDEYMLRSPALANMYLMHHGTSIPEQLATYGPCMQHRYFSKEENMAIFRGQLADKKVQQLATSRTGLFRQLCNENINDYQHWHLGNTLTWTPLRDLEIFKLILQLPVEVAVDQIMDSAVSKQLIARNDPDLLNYVSCEKNYRTLERVWPLLSSCPG
jgi:hypothetical protein